MDRCVFAVAVGLAVSLGGCGGSSPGPSPSSSTSPSPSAETTTTAAKASCVELTADQGTWCVVKVGTDAADVGRAEAYICGEGGVDCSGCDDNSTLIFNAYYQAHETGGNEACSFNGAGQLVTPEGSPCLPSIQDSHWCVPKANVSDTDLQSTLEYICNPQTGGVDCSPIVGGICAYPPKTDLKSKCSWAFNTFYQKNKVTQGNASCDFNGQAELDWAPCGKHNNGNPTTGTGYAYADKAGCTASAEDICGCIQDVTSTFTGCRQCVTKVAGDCEPLCPWVSAVTTIASAAPVQFV